MLSLICVKNSKKIKNYPKFPNKASFPLQLYKLMIIIAFKLFLKNPHLMTRLRNHLVI